MPWNDENLVNVKMRLESVEIAKTDHGWHCATVIFSDGLKDWINEKITCEIFIASVEGNTEKEDKQLAIKQVKHVFRDILDRLEA